MGVPVTIDSDDVEALLFASTAIKGVEEAIRMAVKDQMGESARARFYGGANDRIAAAWRQATRQRDYPERFTPATPEEVDTLVRLWPKPEPREDYPDRPRFASSRHIRMDGRGPGQYRDLLVRGLVEFGVQRQTMIWSSTGDQDVLDFPEVWMRITPRGRQAVLDAEKQPD